MRYNAIIALTHAYILGSCMLGICPVRQAAARARGRLGGRPNMDTDKIKQAVKLYNTKQYSVREIEELTGVKKSTLYRNLNQGVLVA